MRAEWDVETHTVKAATGDRVDEGRPRPSGARRDGAAWAVQTIHTVRLLLLATACAGCAASNYNFDALSEVTGLARGKILAEGLDERATDEERALYDLDVIPLTRTRLNVFGDSGDDGVPGGFVEADVAAYLPLFGIIDATVKRYDSELQLCEHHDFNSFLWGLLQAHREQVETTVGVRETNVLRFLWILPWTSQRYVDSMGELSSPARDPSDERG